MCGEQAGRFVDWSDAPDARQRARGVSTKGVLVGKKSVQADRQARVEQMRVAQKAKERRLTVIVAVAAVTVVAVLIGLVVVVVGNYRSANPDDLALVGVDTASASCGEVESDEASGVNEHVGPGTSSPDVTSVEYDSVPPTHGQHFAQPQFPAEAFYTAETRPAMEMLVHNLEHGYTIVWYADDLPAEQQDQLERIADLARDMDETAGKFIVSAWDPAYGDLPEESPVAMSHWGVESGKRQLCGAVSGAVIEQFVTDNPSSDSPEPDAA